MQQEKASSSGAERNHAQVTPISSGPWQGRENGGNRLTVWKELAKKVYIGNTDWIMIAWDTSLMSRQ